MSGEAERVAEQSLPGWTVKRTPTGDKPRSRSHPKVDSVGVDFDELRKRYFGETRRSDDKGKTRGQSGPQFTEFVVMESLDQKNDPLGPKVVIVRGGKVVGMQG